MGVRRLPDNSRLGVTPDGSAVLVEGPASLPSVGDRVLRSQSSAYCRRTRPDSPRATPVLQRRLENHDSDG